MQAASKSSREKLLNNIRYFNKYTLNHLTLLFAGSKIGPFSELIHKGRKSGKTYRTPIVATFIGDTIIIPLSYGDQVDWLLNILATGGCEIVYRNERLQAINPEVIHSLEAMNNLPEKRRRLFERFKLEKFLRMQIINQ